jgi:hypothetical protein
MTASARVSTTMRLRASDSRKSSSSFSVRDTNGPTSTTLPLL